MLALHKLTRTPTLYGLLCVTIAMTLAFTPLAQHFGLTLLDGISSPQLARETIAAFTADQRIAHAWITATLDVAYPLAYGLLFAGCTLRFFPNAGKYLALPPLLVIPIDLFEGLIQILALLEISDWLALKAVVTPLKLILLASGLITTVAGAFAWAYRRLFS